MKPLARRILPGTLALFIAACAARAPVSLVTLFLPPTVQLQNVEGSLWNGSASAIGTGNMLIQEQVEWHFHPQALLSATLEWAISGKLGEKNSALTLALRPNGTGIKNVSVFLPLEPFAALHPKLQPARFGALIHASANEVKRNAPARIALDVERLHSPLTPQASELGSYRIELDLSANGTGTWQANPVSGVLSASGQGQIDINRAKISGQLLLTPRAPLPGLSPALSQLPRTGDSYSVAF